MNKKTVEIGYESNQILVPKKVYNSHYLGKKESKLPLPREKIKQGLSSIKKR